MLRGANIFITGCSRGLGLEMVHQLVSAHSPGLIFATCRTPQAASELTGLAAAHSNVHLLPLDVDNCDNFPSVSEAVSKLTGEAGINILINNAGVSPKSTRINMVTEQQMMDTFKTNVVAPVLLTKSLIPNLKKGVSHSHNSSLIVNMSSILGSIAENTQGGLYPYRSSKAGLNAVSKSLSLDLSAADILSVAVHPGWVQTDMGGKNAPLTPSESIQGVLHLIDNFKKEQNGGYYDNLGKQLPW